MKKHGFFIFGFLMLICLPFGTMTLSNGSASNTPTVKLTVERVGLGKDFGVVTSSPSGINCGADCVKNFPVNTEVTLTYQNSLNAKFQHFESGKGSVNNNNCGGYETSPCRFLITEDSKVQARFAKNKLIALNLIFSGPGHGQVQFSVGFANTEQTGCNATCLLHMGAFGSSYCGIIVGGPLGECAEVHLTPVPDSGSRFAGWSNGSGPLRKCDGVLSNCVEKIGRDESTTAFFLKQ